MIKDRFLRTDELRENLRQRSVRGAAVTSAGQATKMVLRFGATAVLARLLTPADYGLVAISAVIIGFASIFKDAGLTSATIQREELTHGQVSALFWINTALGISVALIVVACSPLIAAFYKEPRLTGITCALAVTFFLGGLAVQHQALLRRQMRFTALAKIEVGSTIAGVVVGIVMATHGFGYWSLVGMSIGTAVANLVGLVVTVPWRPDAPRQAAGTRQLLVFGSDLLRFNVVNYFSRQADTLLIGWHWGPAALGLYDKAYNLLLLPIGQINAPLAAVAVPALSRIRADDVRYARFFLDGLQLVTSISVPVIAGIAVFSEEVVLLWLGPNWLECAELFRLLAAAALIGAVSNPIGWLLISSGQTRKYRRMGCYTSLIIVISFIVGLRYGAAGVATSYSVAMCLLFVPVWYFSLKDSPVRIRAVFDSLMPSFVSVMPAAFVALNIRHWGSLASLPQLATIVAAVAFGAVYGLMLLGLFRRWSFFLAILHEFRLRDAGQQYSPART